MRWVGHVIRMGKKGDACWIRAVRYEGKRLLGKPRCR
jgi:alkylated DNA nucleotide flippase Atl1